MPSFDTVIKGEAGVQRLFDLYRKFGASDYIGEPISQTSHACQAGMLAELEGAAPASGSIRPLPRPHTCPRLILYRAWPSFKKCSTVDTHVHNSYGLWAMVGISGRHAF
jgi:hypothetical protein